MLPSTQLLEHRAIYRLVLEEQSWFVGAATLAKKFFETAASTLPAWAAAPPSSPQNGVWVQDIAIADGAGNLTAGQLVAEIERQYSIHVRNLERLDPAVIGASTGEAETERDQATHVEAAKKTQETASSGLKATVAKVTSFLKTARAVFVLATVVAVLWYAWPWLVPWFRALRRGKLAAK